MDALTITTCMAPNMDFICRDLAGYLAGRLSVPVRAEIDIPWQERERRFDAGEIDLCWICGLPYVRMADLRPGEFLPLVAPVMAGERYQGRPIYYSDVVVRRDSPFTSLDDLRGAAWSYNEPGSQSGYGVVRYALAKRGESLEFFGRLVEAGSHQASLQMILRGEVDGSAIDSTVLERELQNDPSIEDRIRRIDTFSPSPIPPWVVTSRVPGELRWRLMEALTQMGADARGAELLKKAGIARYVPVSDRDYDLIREMDRFADSRPANGMD